MSYNKIFKSISNVYFSNATSDVNFQENTIEIYNARLTLDVKSVDTATTVTTVEEAIQAVDSTPGYALITTTIISTDFDIIIALSPAVTNIKVDVTSDSSESTVDGVTTSILISKVTIDNIDQHVYADATVIDNSAIVLPEPTYRYLILRHDLIDGYLHGNPGGDYNMTCQEMYSLMNITCVKLSEGIYQTLRQTWIGEKVIEIDKDTAFYGTTFFSEIRPVAKVWEAKTSWYGEKIPTEITSEIVGYILTVMKTFAIEILDTEYERRFLAMRAAGQLEYESWKIQLAEANEWLTHQGADGHVTPFLDYMAITRKIDKTTLANKIVAKSEIYQDKLSQLLVEMQISMSRFNSCDSVWDINILYEDYFGIALPIKQAIELGRTVSADNWNRLPKWSVKGNGYYF